MDVDIFHLNLISPVYVVPVNEPEPFVFEGEGSGGVRESIFCFELDEEEHLAFEPDQSKLLKNLIFGGEAAVDNTETGSQGTAKEQIPRGNYLFAQVREILSKDEIIAMAAEVQTEGLWRRFKPAKNLYLRYLFEDGSWVTQLFRPC